MKPSYAPHMLFCTVALFAIVSGSKLAAQEFTNHSYQVVSGSFTWNQAKGDAELRGGHLATLTSQAEANHVQSLGILGAIPGEAFWLGASDELQEGTWTWVTGEPFSFALWASGEPNNGVSGNEDYLASTDTVNAPVWNDWGGANSVLSYYILEIDHPCWVSIAISKVKVTQHVVLGRNYILESSTNLVTWVPTGPQFTAVSQSIVTEFDVDVTGRFFRLREVP
jgi:hypothetical protein